MKYFHNIPMHKPTSPRELRIWNGDSFETFSNATRFASSDGYTGGPTHHEAWKLGERTAILRRNKAVSPSYASVEYV